MIITLIIIAYLAKIKIEDTEISVFSLYILFQCCMIRCKNLRSYSVLLLVRTFQPKFERMLSGAQLSLTNIRGSFKKREQLISL